MLLFVLCCFILVVVITVTLIPALLNRKSLREVDIEKVNLDIARQRLIEAETAGSAVGATLDNHIDAELEATLMDDLTGPDYKLKTNRPTGPVASILVILAIPLSAAVLYGYLGNATWLNPPAGMSVPANTASNSAAAPADGNAMASLDVLLTRLEQSLQDNPQNPQGWTLAARTYMSIGRYQQAEDAFSMANQLVGPDPDILTAWSDATLMVNGNNFTPEIDARINQALELEPQQINALWIAGLSADARGDGAAAFGYFSRVRPLLGDDVQAIAQVDQMLLKFSADAGVKTSNALVSRVQAAVPAATASTVTQSTTDQANAAMQVADANGKSVVVEVKLDAALAASVSPQDLVFIFARAPAGPPFPLAAMRVTVAELPITVTLDDSKAMMPAQNISSVDQVAVLARVAKGGNPIAQPGDLTSETVVTETTGSTTISLTIDRVVE